MHNERTKDIKKVKIASVKTVLNYWKEFGIKLSGDLQKMNAAQEKGKLEEYLD